MKPLPKKIVKKPTIDYSLLNGYKLDFTRGFFVIVLSLIAYGFVALLLQLFYHPDTSQVLEFAKKVVLNYYPDSYKPEPKERMFFVLGVISITFFLVVFYWLSKKLKFKTDNKNINSFYIGTLILGLLPIAYVMVKGIMEPNPFGGTYLNSMDLISKTNWDFYFKDTFIYNNLFLYTLLIFPCILFLFLFPFKITEKTQGIIDTSTKTLVYGFCAIIVLLVFLISAFRFPYSYENKYDFNAVFYSVVQVYNGLPLLVDNFMNTYGLYPHFVVPVMKLMGGSVVSFTLIMAFLLSACFVFLFYVLRQTVSNLFLVLFSFCSVFFMCYMFARIALPYDNNFAMFPIRWILPFGLMFFGSVYLKNKTRWLYYSSFFIFSLGFLWSPDFGMLCYAALLMFYIYLELESKDIFVIIRKSLIHIVFAIIGMVLTIALYMLSIKLIYGNYPDFKMLFSAINVFSMIGFNMLPLTTSLHPWMLVALIYVVGLAYSAWHFIEKRYTYKSCMVFLITVIGIACFSYYQGRSHNWNLLAVCPYAFILLAIFADELLTIIKKHKIFYIPFSFIVFILGFSVFQTLYNYKPITDLVNEEQNKAEFLAENQDILRNGGFIKENTTERERVLILTKAFYQGLYYNLSKTASAVNPGLSDLFLKEDNDRIVNWIKNNQQSKIFLDPEGFRTRDYLYYTYMSTFYQVKKSQGPGGKLVMLTRQAENPNSAFILKQEPQSIVHELFDKNFDNRLSYTMGKKGNITTNDRFSVEIIFKPGEILPGNETKAQTLIFNIREDAGFAVQQNDTSMSQYLICVGQRCMIIPIVPGKWNYLAFEINKNTITAYSNGRLTGQAPMPDSYKNSAEKLYIGSIKNSGGFFFGDIKEVKISNTPLILSDVQTAWNTVEKKINELHL